MDDTEEGYSDRMQRLQSSFGTTSSRQCLSVDQLNIPSSQASPNQNQNPSPTQFRARSFAQTRPPSHPHQIPPLSPYSQIPATRPPANSHSNFNPTHHSRSLSQPAFFSLDSLPPLSPSPYRDSLPSPTSSSSIPIENLSLASSMDERELTPVGKSAALPPRKSHRRSNSDIPFGFSSFSSAGPPPLVKREQQSSKEGEAADDLFSAYMNLDGIEALNSSGTDERTNENNNNHHESSDNEAESSMNSASGGTKRRARGDISPAPSRHYRSVSFDSFMGGLSFGDESPKVPLSPGTGPVQLSPSNSIDGSFGLEIGNNGEFSEAEMKKIMANDKLTEIALSDPKRVKRILANRQSAARSKERKTRYISELEHKVQTLQTEATTLSAQLTLLQRDSVGLTNHNNELKYRLQAMEQQAQLRDALSEALTTEVQRLKMSLAEINGSPQMFQMQPQFNMSQSRSQSPSQSVSQSQSQSQLQNGGSAQKPESK